MIQIAEVRAQLALESSDALSTVDTLGTALDTVVTNFSTSFDSAIAALEPQIAALGAGGTSESIVADPSQAIASLQEVDAATQSTTAGLIDLGVAGTTALDDVATAGTDAGSALDTVSTSTSTASDGLSGLDAGTAALTGSLAAAKGEGTGVAEALGGLGIVSGGTTAAVVGTAAAMGALFEAGLKEEASAQRLKLAFGDQATAIKQIDIGGLNGNLDDLAQKVGTTTAALNNGLARLGEYGSTAGFSSTQVKQTTQDIAALALRAVALNPALGSVDQVIQQMSRSLGTGGARAQQFYIQLNRQDIVEQAIKMFGGAASALTPFEKSAAAASLEVEKLGGKLGTDFTNGADTADNKLKALKATVENAFAKAGTGLVDSLTELGSVVVPLVTLFSSGLGAAFSVFSSTLGVLAPLVEAFARGIGAIADGFNAVPAPVIIGLGVALAALAIDFDLVATSIGVLTLEMLDNPITLFAVGIATAATAFGLFGDSATSAKTDLAALAKEGDDAFTAMADSLAALQKLGSQQGGLLGTVAIAETKAALSDLQGLADQSTGAAQRLGQAYVTAGDITEKQFTTAIKNGIQAQKDAAIAAQQAANATSLLSTAQQAEVFTANAATAAAKDKDKVYSASITTYNALTAVGLASGAATQAEATAYSNASQAASNYKTSLDVLNQGHLSLAQATQANAAQELSLKDALTKSQGSLELNTASGNAAYAAVLQQVSAEQAYETALAASSAGVAGAAAAHDAFRATLAKTLTDLNVAPEAIGPLLDSLGVSLPTAAATGVSDLGASIGTVPSTVQTASNAVVAAASGIPAQFSTIGNDAGSNLDLALAYSIKAGSPNVEAVAQQMIRDVKKAMDNAGSPTEHLFHDSGMSFVTALGDGMAAAGSDVVAQAQAITRAAAATTVPVGAGVGATSGVGVGAVPGSGPSQTNIFHGYSPQETAAVTGREWTRLTRFSGGG